MSLPRNLLLAGLLGLASSAGLAAFSPDAARALYREKFAESAPGVYEDGDVLFLVLQLDFDEDIDADDRDLKRLDAQLEAIETWIGTPPAPEIVSPFAKKLSAIVRPTGIAPFKIPEANSCDIDQSETKTGERYVVAIDLIPLREAREKAKAATSGPVRLGVGEWADRLKETYNALRSEGERRTFRALLGVPFLDAAAAPGVAVTIERADMVAVARTILACPTPKTVEDANRILSAIPTYPPALLVLSDRARDENNFAEAIVLAREAALAGEGGSLCADLARKAAETFETDAWLEWEQLLEEFCQGDSFFSGRKDPMWNHLRVCGGCLSFPGAPTGGVDEFERAKVLFKQGKNVPEILSLLCDSIEKGPNTAEKWTYLAWTLKVDDKASDALLCYQEALRLGAQPETVLPRMIPLLDSKGSKALATGAAWWVLSFGDKTAAEHAKAFLAASCKEFDN